MRTPPELTTNELIMIVLGIIVLVILAIGFTIGWNRFFPFLQPTTFTVTKEVCENQTYWDRNTSSPIELKTIQFEMGGNEKLFEPDVERILSSGSTTLKETSKYAWDKNLFLDLCFRNSVNDCINEHITKDMDFLQVIDILPDGDGIRTYQGTWINLKNDFNKINLTLVLQYTQFSPRIVTSCFQQVVNQSELVCSYIGEKENCSLNPGIQITKPWLDQHASCSSIRNTNNFCPEYKLNNYTIEVNK